MIRDEEKLIKFISDEVKNIPLRLNDEISFNGKKYNRKSEFDTLIEFMDDFLKGDTINRYFVLPGLRDVGKSTLLFHLYEYLLKKQDVPPQNILYVSAENLREIFDYNIMDAVNMFLKQYHNDNLRLIDEKIFLFIDEAQYDKKWSITGKVIYDTTKNVFMIFSGSSAIDFEYNADSARRLLKLPITPLNYGEHLRLKYNFKTYNISEALRTLIFQGDITQAVKCENKIIKSYPSIEGYSSSEWNDYLMYGGLPASFHQNPSLIIKRLKDTIDRVILVDIPNISNFSRESVLYSSRLLYFFAQQNPGQISRASMSNYLDCHINTVNNIIDTLEKTHLIFHVESFSSSPKRKNKPYKYYYATPSLRHALAYNLGIASTNPKQYEGILFENLVASIFFNLKIKSDNQFNLYFDTNKNSNVDFLVQKDFENVVPIEAGIGKKTKKQVKNAIDRYNSSHGIIISDTSQKIKKEDNIIYLPLETFSFL